MIFDFSFNFVKMAKLLHFSFPDLIYNSKRIMCNLIRREDPAGPIIIFRCHPPHLKHSELNVFPSGARDSFYIYLI